MGCQLSLNFEREEKGNVELISRPAEKHVFFFSIAAYSEYLVIHKLKEIFFQCRIQTESYRIYFMDSLKAFQTETQIGNFDIEYSIGRHVLLEHHRRRIS
jgi:hypothetical protein